MWLNKMIVTWDDISSIFFKERKLKSSKSQIDFQFFLMFHIAFGKKHIGKRGENASKSLKISW
jgi:hypothetical protein